MASYRASKLVTSQTFRGKKITQNLLGLGIAHSIAILFVIKYRIEKTKNIWGVPLKIIKLMSLSVKLEFSSK